MRTSVLRMLLLAMLLALAAGGCGRPTRNAPPPGPGAQQPPPPGPKAGDVFSLTSTAFQTNSPIPSQYTAAGQGLSPPLAWANLPAGTKSMAMIAIDPDAPGGSFVHWVLYDLPPKPMSLPAGVPKTDTLPDHGGIKQGTNSAGAIGYTPPNPPPGKVHHYDFRLFALDAPVNLTPGAAATDLEKMMQGHIVGTTDLVGTFQR